MKKLSDNELQQLLENKQQLPESTILGKDADAYRVLFEALHEEPSNGLPYDFAAKVSRHVQANEKRSNELKYNFVAVLIFIGVLGCVCSLLAFFTPDQVTILLKYKWILLLFPPAFIII